MVRTRRTTPVGETSGSNVPTSTRRTTRQTRSQSRELGDSDAPTASRRNLKSSKGAAREKTPRDVTSAPSRPGEGLSPVLENDFTFPEKRHHAHSPARSRPSAGTLSFEHEQANISGTTFLPTDSEYESRDLDPSLMIEALPDLDTASQKILDFLAPRGFLYADIAKDRGRPRFAAKLNRLKEAFQAQKKCYGKKHFISLHDVTGGLPPLRDAQGQVHAVLQKANLAQLALDIIPRDDYSLSEKEFIELDSGFPSFSVTSLLSGGNESTSPGASLLLRETFALGLEIRTQYVITLLGRAQINETDVRIFDIISEVFHANSSDDDEVLNFRGWNIGGLKDQHGNVPDELYDEVQDRNTAVESIISRNNYDPTSSLSALKLQFPWSELVIGAATWARARGDEINKVLELQGPLDDVVYALQAELDRRPSFGHSPTRTSQSLLAPETPARKRTGPGAPLGVSESEKSAAHSAEQAGNTGEQRSFLSWPLVRHLYDHRASSEASKQPATPHQHQVSRSEDRDVRSRPPGGLPDFLGLIREAEGGTSRNQETTSPARRALIDRQENATRVSSIDPDHESTTDSPQRGQKRKRTAPSRDERDTSQAPNADEEDDEFQQDERNVDVERNRARIPKPPPSKRPRVEGTSGPSGQQQSRSSSVAVVEAGLSGTARSGSLESTRRRGPMTFKKSPMKRGETGRVRKPWTTEECQQLIRLVGIYGSAWSAISRADEREDEPKLADRSQVDLKDKAGQLVFNYLKNKEELPKNFEYVPVKGHHKRKLEEMGIRFEE